MIVPPAQPMFSPEMASRSDPTVALALGGGGARGLAHIHVVEVLDELGVRPVAIAGASIGAIVGAGMASGMEGLAIRDFALTTFGKRSELASRLWRLRPHSLKEVLSPRGRFGQFDVERILRCFLPDVIPDRFEDLKTPMKIVVTDFYDQCERLCETGDLFTAIGASAALPAIFRPVLRDGRVLIDGGIYNPVPFDHLEGLADIVIGVDVVGGPAGEAGRIPSWMDAVFGASQLMMQSIIALKLKAGPPDIFLRPEVGRFGVMDFMRVEELLSSTSAIRDELKFGLDAAIERKMKTA